MLRLQLDDHLCILGRFDQFCLIDNLPRNIIVCLRLSSLCIRAAKRSHILQILLEAPRRSIELRCARRRCGILCFAHRSFILCSFLRQLHSLLQRALCLCTILQCRCRHSLSLLCSLLILLLRILLKSCTCIRRLLYRNDSSLQRFIDRCFCCIRIIRCCCTAIHIERCRIEHSGCQIRSCCFVRCCLSGCSLRHRF